VHGKAPGEGGLGKYFCRSARGRRWIVALEVEDEATYPPRQGKQPDHAKERSEYYVEVDKESLHGNLPDKINGS